MTFSATQIRHLLELKYKNLGAIDGTLVLSYYLSGDDPNVVAAQSLTLSPNAIAETPPRPGMPQAEVVGQDEQSFLVANYVFADAAWTTLQVESRLNSDHSRLSYRGSAWMILSAQPVSAIAGMLTEWRIRAKKLTVT